MGAAGERFTRVLGIPEGLSRIETAAEVQALKRKHAAIAQLIAALEACELAGCDLRYVQCLGCEKQAQLQRRRRNIAA